MAAISSKGVAEGVDVTKVMGNAPLLRLNVETPPPSQLEDVTSISAGGRQQSAFASLAEAASQLTSQTLWSSTVASSSAPEAASARSNTQTPVRNYQVEVAQLASAQVTSTHTFSSLSTVVGLGSLSIEMGSWDVPPTTFVANPNWPKANVVLGPKNDTLDRVRDKINAAGLGVVATVVSDATGSRLVLRSTGTGVDNGFKITTEEAEVLQAPTESSQDIASLSDFGFDPSAKGRVGMQLEQAASNAQARINGEMLESPTNVIENQAGLSLILKKTTDTPITIRVGPDRASMQEAAQNFAQAYNTLQNLGGSVANSVQRSTESLLGTPDRPSTLAQSLEQAGVTRTPAGELQIDTQQLTATLRQDSDAVRRSLTMLSQQVLADLPVRPDSALPATDPPVSSPNSTAGAQLRLRLLEQYQGVPTQTGIGNQPSFLATSRT